MQAVHHTCVCLAPVEWYVISRLTTLLNDLLACALGVEKEMEGQ